MEDLSQLSDEQLMAVANQGQSALSSQPMDLSSMSDEQLTAMLNQGPQQATEDAGWLSKIADAVTGNSRKTAEIEELPDWRGNMPEFSISQGLPALKTSLGTMTTGPEETAKIIQHNFPEVRIRQDEKGNYIFRSGIDKQEYALKPGLRMSDIPRGVAQILMFLPASKATSILGAGLAAGATQAAIEGSQSATGGEFNPGEIGLAAGMGSAGEVASRILGSAFTGATRILGGKSFIPPEVAATVSSVSREAANADLEELVNKAASESLSANKYKRRLAERAKVDPTALAAVHELGIEVPVDVYSDNPQLRAIVGTGRSIKGSEAQNAWRETVTGALERADNALAKVEADVPVSEVSENVLKSLKKTQDALKSETKAAYDEVDAAIPKKTIISQPSKKTPVAELSAEEQQAQQLNERISSARNGRAEAPPVEVEVQGPGLPNLKATLEKAIEDRGADGLRPQEADLLNALKNQKITYGRLIAEKHDLRRALRGKQTPYSNLDQGLVEDLYNAISRDQLNAAEQLGGEAVRDRLVSANLLYTKQKQVEKTLVDAFGKDFNGSIVPQLTGAVTEAKAGNVSALNSLLQTVPEPLQRQALLSAITSSAKVKSGERAGQVGLTQFANIWGGISAQPQILEKIRQVVGQEAFSVLSGINTVARLIDRSAREISYTGASNQAILRSMRSNSLMDNLLGRTFLTYVGGSLGGGLGATIGAALARVPKDRLAAAGKMFNSPEFQAIMQDVMNKTAPAPSLINSFAKSRVFSNFAALAKLPSDPGSKIRWVKQAMMSQHDMAMPQAAFQEGRTVAEVLQNGTVKTDPATKFKIVQKPGGKYRLLAPDGSVSVFSTEEEAVKSATRQLRVLTNSPLK
jgi:hypothetical protein